MIIAVIIIEHFVQSLHSESMTPSYFYARHHFHITYYSMSHFPLTVCLKNWISFIKPSNFFWQWIFVDFLSGFSPTIGTITYACLQVLNFNLITSCWKIWYLFSSKQLIIIFFFFYRLWSQVLEQPS